MHLLAQLRQVEQLFKSELVVIGVHSGKFHAERKTENIRQAVLRLEIEHPVVNDWQFRVWRAYAVNAWPTLAFLDPDGRYIGSHAGEIPAESLANLLRNIVVEFDAKGKINRRPLAFPAERPRAPDHVLAFPQKAIATEDGRLFVADTNHHRILCLHVTEEGTSGTVAAIIGRGEAGLADGDFHIAAFRHPHGLALAGEQLYVADTDNHAIRQVDLTARQVTTIAGTGEQAQFMTGGRGLEVSLNSPWDVLHCKGNLYIAMAGSHQLWRLDLVRNEIYPHAGTGTEALIDGPLTRAALAQPSGLTTDGTRLYFADSESSAIRWADFDPTGRTGTIVGKGLFDFGDKDGKGDAVRLQHPLGIVWVGDKLYVADTYNNRIKAIHPGARSAVTFLGTGEPGQKDGEAPTFWEPGGISAARGKLHIADTNNHAIRVAHLATRRVSTLSLQGEGVEQKL